MQLEEIPAPFFEYSPPWRDPDSEEDEEALLDFDLEALPELEPEVDHFLLELAGSSEQEERKRSSPEPPVEDFQELGDLESPECMTHLTDGRN